MARNIAYTFHSDQVDEDTILTGTNGQNPMAQNGEWRDLRDERGKLCARIDSERMLLEIRRSDRDLIAYFDLRDYVEQLRTFEVRGDIG